MKAAYLTGIRSMGIGEIAAPEIRHDTDVLVTVRAVGVCGSDVHNYVEGGIGSRRVTYPFIPGHEGAGEVVAIGAAVSRVRVGDHVVIEPAHSCGQCDQCVAGRFNTCREIKFMSAAGEMQGCMCEQVVIPEGNCYPVPTSMSDEAAALAEPLSIAIYAVQQSIALAPDTPVVILGAGPIGLCTMLAAKAAGATTFYVTDRLPERLARAEALGASWVGNPDEIDVVGAIKEREPSQVPVVFECCGQPEALDQGVLLLRPGGRLMMIGIPEGCRVSLDIDEMRRKEITLVNVRRQNECVEAAIELLASGEIDTGRLVTHRIALAETQRAFEMVADYSDGVLKAMVVNPPPPVG